MFKITVCMSERKKARRMKRACISCSGRTEGRRYYAALQELVIIEISHNGYHQPEYDTSASPISRPICGGASRAQGKGRIIHDFTPVCPSARIAPPIKFSRLMKQVQYGPHWRTGAVLSFAFPFLQ